VCFREGPEVLWFDGSGLFSVTFLAKKASLQSKNKAIKLLWPMVGIPSLQVAVKEMSFNLFEKRWIHL